MGLGNVFEHYIDIDFNKFFTSHSRFFGSFIRQIQTPDTKVYDASNGESFHNKMIQLGFECKNEDKLFGVHENYKHFVYHIPGSNNGIPNKAVKIN